MNETTAHFIWRMMQDTINSFGLEEWCRLRCISVDDFKDFQDRVDAMIETLEDAE